jgi:hypothetical protein
MTFTDSIRNALKPFYLFVYRGGAFVVISTALMFLVFWGLIMTFFMFNTSWVAPTVLSATSDKMLQFNSGYLAALQTEAQLNVILQQQTLTLATSQKQYNDLVAFRESIQSGSLLQAKKQLDLKKSSDVAAQLEQTRKQTEQNLRIGLVDKLDAIKELATIQQFNNTRTDSEIGLATLKQQLINLDGQILTLHDSIAVEQQTIDETKKNLTVAQQVLTSLRQSAYANATNNGVNLVFVAYDNFNNVHEGDPVYDCYLMVVACHQVGTIKHLFKDEQLIEFPIFNIKLSRTVRGVFAEVNATDPAAMKSSVWFAGRKPLFL